MFPRLTTDIQVSTLLKSKARADDNATNEDWNMCKMKMTVAQAVKHPYVAAIYVDPLLASAREIADLISLRVVRSHEILAGVDRDNDNAWELATDELFAAQAAFLKTHRDTEVSL